MPLLGRAAVPVEGAAVARPRMRAEKMIDRQPVLRAGVARNSAAPSASAISGSGAACPAVGVVANVGEGREFDWAFDWPFDCEFGGKKENVIGRLSAVCRGVRLRCEKLKR